MEHNLAALRRTAKEASWEAVLEASQWVSPLSGPYDEFWAGCRPRNPGEMLCRFCPVVQPLFL